MVFDEVSKAVCRVTLASPGAELDGGVQTAPAGRGNPGVRAGAGHLIGMLYRLPLPWSQNGTLLRSVYYQTVTYSMISLFVQQCNISHR